MILATVAVDAEDIADALELREHTGELLDARDLQGRVDRRGLVRVRLRREREELHLVLAYHPGDIAQEAVAVPTFDADRDRIGTRRRALPFDFDEALLVR